MAILGSSIDPRLQLQDYSGFVNAAKMQAQGLAGLGQQISQAADQYKQYKKEQQEALKRVKQAEVFGNAITTLLPETKGSIGAAIEKLRDPNIPLYERDAIAQSISSIANIGVAQQEIGLKREQLGLERQNMIARALANQPNPSVIKNVIPVPVGGGTQDYYQLEDGRFIPADQYFREFGNAPGQMQGQVPTPTGDFDNPPGYGVPAFQETRSFPQLMYDIYDEETMNLINKARSENPNLSDQEIIANLAPTINEISIYSANAAKQAFDAEGRKVPSNYLDPNFIRSAIEMRGEMPQQGQAPQAQAPSPMQVGAQSGGPQASSQPVGFKPTTPKVPFSNPSPGFTVEIVNGVPVARPIEGDPAVAKAQADAAKAQADLDAAKAKADADKKAAAAEEEKAKTRGQEGQAQAFRMAQDANMIKNDYLQYGGVDGPFDAVRFEVESKMPGTVAYTIIDDLAALEDRIGEQSLQRVRNNSPTGASFGNISDKDIQLLKSAYGSLNPKSKTFLKDMNRFINLMYDVVHGSKEQRLQLVKDGKITQQQNDQIESLYNPEMDIEGRQPDRAAAPMGFGLSPEIQERLKKRQKQ